MEHDLESLHALAEAVSGPSRELTAGLLLRPAPVPGEHTVDITPLCRKIQALLQDAIPALQEGLAALEDCDVDELEEQVEELTTPAFDLVDMARAVWAAPLTPELETARPLLATVIEAPVAELLTWMLHLMHAALDPWAVLDDPEEPALDYCLEVQDGPVRDALRQWRQQHPGLLPEDFLL